VIDAIIQSIDDEGHRDFEGDGALLCDGISLLLIARSLDHDVISVVVLGPPTVDWMCLSDVHSQEADPIAETLVNRLEGPELGPEIPSREAPENEDYRPAGSEVGQLDYLPVVRGCQCEVWRCLTHLGPFIKGP
jgi:hypothetical protein